MKRLQYAPIILALGGLILIGMGLYFVFVRPPLLPEDPRYIGTSMVDIQVAVPGLMMWLRRVFWVMGGYMFTSGLLTIYVALTSFRAGDRGAVLVVGIAGLTSIGWMAGVNFLIDSDFKWLLLAFALPWPLALVLYRLKR